MKDKTLKRRVRGWMMFDWASQPYNTLLLTFIFGPYFTSILSDRLVGEGAGLEAANAHAQAVWGWAIAIAGAMIAILAPVLGAMADSSGRRLPFIYLFSVFYIVGSAGLWLASPDDFNAVIVLAFFVIGLIGMEFATTFTNAMLPELGKKEDIGRISGTGWAIGYCGGLVALILTLCFLAENEAGKTLIGMEPLFGLDAQTREGTRSVGPLSALWYVVFMIPFFLWVREGPGKKAPKGVIAAGLKGLKSTIKGLPRTPSLMTYLVSSMFYRDALAGMYIFGGVYAEGVLDWTVVDIGVFGIIAVTSGAIFAYIGGKSDSKRGPKPVIVVSILALIFAAIGIICITPTSIMGVPVSGEDVVGPYSAPDLVFMLLGCTIGAAGGTVQAASRTMVVRQANPERMTEAFGLYALAGKATAFLAPFLIGLVSALSDSQRLGMTPVVGLFLLGLILLIWVKPEGEDHSKWASATS